MTTALMTVEEFAKLNDPPGVRLELHHGAPVEVTRPIRKHAVIQRNLFRLLDRFAPGGEPEIECAFRPHPEHELWVADVAWTSSGRDESANLEGWLEGAPELVVEVLSPSNTYAEILEKQELCLATGAHEFWVVDPDRKTVQVTLRDGRTRIYHPGEVLPLSFAPGSSITASDLFPKD